MILINKRNDKLKSFALLTFASKHGRARGKEGNSERGVDVGMAIEIVVIHRLHPGQFNTRAELQIFDLQIT
ncbi:hypothetical protein [Franconibacter daqui]|uniref:hypothetical protein n=1 Tax=Franconibacter daqui TaxID=2047724 RepID=UPI002DBCBFBD|nr:hypothetical protein [Franconibacter daqui]MEB5922420.1 hypothetical protein [Franconibacter daqui]